MFKKNSLLLMISLLALTLAACAATESQATELPAPVEVSVDVSNESSLTVVSSTEDTASEISIATDTVATINQAVTSGAYPLVDTGQGICHDDSGERISCPAEGEAFYGQDAQYTGAEFAFQDNGDGTVTDLNTGLMWQVTPSSQSFSYEEAVEYAENLEFAGYDDWRLPSTKELFSISDFSAGWPYLDKDVFDIAGNSVSKDEQFWTEYYVGLTHGGNVSAFGVNHGTGHIKSYPVDGRGNYVRLVRGETYGINDFVDNGDGTVTDLATGLMWSQDDSGVGMEWEDALAYAEGAELAGYDDWRLPNVKELQSILEYGKSPNAVDSDDLGPAIDVDFFNITALASGTTAYDPDYGYFWTSTSAYQNARQPGYNYAWYVAFGTAPGPDGNDTHGAGAVRFAGKVEGGPDGEDAARVNNYVRLVRGGDVTETPQGDPTTVKTDRDGEVANPGGGQGGPSGQRGQPGGGQRGQPDFTAAAKALGVTEEDLIDALGVPADGQPHAPAEQPAVSDTQPPAPGGQQGGPGGQQGPDLAAAAAQLGITEEVLIAALGVPEGGPPSGGGQGGPPGGGPPPSN